MTKFSKYQVGQHVVSIKRGDRPRFVGHVVSVFVTGNEGLAYNVIDDEGEIWHRETNELSAANEYIREGK